MIKSEFSNKEVAEMIAMYQQGHGLMYIAAHYYSNNGTIRQVLIQNGIAIRARGGYVITAPEDIVRKAIDMYNSGNSINAIGKLVGYSDTTIRKWLTENGVRLKPRGYEKPKQKVEVKTVAEIVEGEPIDCDTQGKRCIYRSKDVNRGLCDYCLTVGRCRGGSPHECTKYKFPEKKKRVK